MLIDIQWDRTAPSGRYRPEFVRAFDTAGGGRS